MEKINVFEKCALLAEAWRPKILGQLNGQDVKLVKFRGSFIWHHHDREDELFLGVRGRFRIEFADRAIDVEPGEFVIVPRGVEHRTSCELEACVLIFEPSATRNTGNVVHGELTAPIDDRL